MNPKKLFYQFFKFKGIYGFGFLLFWILPFKGFANDVQLIKDRIITELLSSQIDDREVETLINTQYADGTWPGINYEDVSRTAFEHRIHSGNMVTLAKAYRTPSSEFSNSKAIIEGIEKALAHWVDKDYFCDNWWHNQIGTPTHLVDYNLDGISKTMVFGKFPDAGVKNRSVAKEGALKPMGSTTPRKLMKITAYRKPELKKSPLRIPAGNLGNYISA